MLCMVIGDSKLLCVYCTYLFLGVYKKILFTKRKVINSTKEYNNLIVSTSILYEEMTRTFVQDCYLITCVVFDGFIWDSSPRYKIFNLFKRKR